MTSVEQHKMVQQLKQAALKMSSDERRSFEMMVKRDRDDEEFDAAARAELQQLFVKFFPKHTKEDMDNRWKKLTGES